MPKLKVYVGETLRLDVERDGLQFASVLHTETQNPINDFRGFSLSVLLPTNFVGINPIYHFYDVSLDKITEDFKKAKYEELGKDVTLHYETEPNVASSNA